MTSKSLYLWVEKQKRQELIKRKGGGAAIGHIFKIYNRESNLIES